MITQDFQLYIKEIEQCKELIPKWFEYLALIPEKNRWKLALILENTQRARSAASLRVSSERKFELGNKSALYAAADWFLNFPFHDIINIMPVSQPSFLTCHITNGELMQESDAVHTLKVDDIGTAFVDQVIAAILEIADYPIAAIPVAEISEYKKLVNAPPNTRLVATLFSMQNKSEFDVKLENGARIKDGDASSIYTDKLPANELVYCFNGEGDYSSPITLHPYVIGLLGPGSERLVRGGVHKFKGATKFFHRIRII